MGAYDSHYVGPRRNKHNGLIHYKRCNVSDGQCSRIECEFYPAYSALQRYVTPSLVLHLLLLCDSNLSLGRRTPDDDLRATVDMRPATGG